MHANHVVWLDTADYRERAYIKYILLAQGATAAPAKPQPLEPERLLLAAKNWFTDNGLTFARNLVVAILIFVIGRMISNAVHQLIVRVLENRKVDQTASRFVANIASVAIMVLVVITALGQLGIPTTQFAALIAAAGLAIGLALQGNLSNFAAGFLIIIFRPFKAGDEIAGGGTAGVVEDLQVFTTIITTPDNKRIIVPNSKFTSDSITNFTAHPSRRVNLPFVAGLQNAPQRVQQALLAGRRRGNPGVQNSGPGCDAQGHQRQITLRTVRLVQDHGLRRHPGQPQRKGLSAFCRRANRWPHPPASGADAGQVILWA